MSDIVPRYIPGPRATTHDWAYVDIAEDGMRYHGTWHLKDGLPPRFAPLARMQILEWVYDQRWLPSPDYAYLQLPEGF